ncbi:MAG: HD domain-containing protein [Bacteroidales bacterium]
MYTANKYCFSAYACRETSSKWKKACAREHPISKRIDEIRSDFSRDANRILHCTAYSRLKSKTQVFYRTHNDQICTRIEHVNYVNSVSTTIADFLGLNTELCQAISLGHDLGHAPFGHSGESILSTIGVEHGLSKFWHEQNSLNVVDNLELLEDNCGNYQNLNLSYGVRDGIISHCGEVDEKSIFPREEPISLSTIVRPNQYAPYTWEACIVKIADKISYLGRDIDDALRLKILSADQIKDLRDILKIENETINNTNLIHGFIIDLCKHSNPETGICFSPENCLLMAQVKKFNYTHIYKHKRLLNYNAYARLVLTSIFNTLFSLYQGADTLDSLKKESEIYPKLCNTFSQWLNQYSAQARPKLAVKYQNKILYDLQEPIHYTKAILDFMASLTDRFVIELFEELTVF